MRAAVQSATVIALLIGASCVHTGRQPAAIPETFAQRCERAIRNFVQISSIDEGEPRQRHLLNASLHLAQYNLPNRARAALAAPPSCARNVTLANLESEISAKNGAIQEAYTNLERFSEEIQFLNSSPVSSDPLFARHATCVARCQGSDDDCIQQCGTTPRFLTDMSSSNGILMMVGNCMDFNNEFENDQTIFEQLFNNYRAQIVSVLQTGAREAPQLIRRMDQITRDLAEILARVQIARITTTLPSCPQRAPTWERSLRRSVVLLRDPNRTQDGTTMGTGFYIRDPEGGLRLVTAQHVYNPSQAGGLELGLRNLEAFRARRAKGPAKFQSVPFEPEPGLFDRGNDIIQTRVSGNQPPLEVISESATPARNQKFFIVGFPGGDPDNFRHFECRFFGFDRSFAYQSERPSYVLDCSGVPRELGGISGGPLLDEEGRVWGVISEYSPIIGRVYVSPMSRAENGAINMGITRIFLTDLCLRDNMLGLKRCQMMPSAYSLIP